MEALFDPDGQVRAWLQENSDYIFSRDGKPLAFITWGNVYDWRGRHLGWWDQGHMRDHDGAVCVFTRVARGMIVAKPGLGGDAGIPWHQWRVGPPRSSGVAWPSAELWSVGQVTSLLTPQLHVRRRDPI